MNENFVPGGCLPCLGRGASLSIWSLRLSACNRSDTPYLYDHISGEFGEAADRFMGALYDLSVLLGRRGGRAIVLAPPNVAAITKDEATLLRAFSACQTNRASIVERNIAALLSRSAAPQELGIVRDYAAVFLEQGLAINSLETSPPAAAIHRPKIVSSPYAGHA